MVDLHNTPTCQWCGRAFPSQDGIGAFCGGQCASKYRNSFRKTRHTGTFADIEARSVRMDNGCLIWSRHIQKHGYGHIVVSGKSWLAHRLAYEMAKGPIPAGMILDHLCRNRACVNPDHLEPVTVAENARRGLNGILRTHCCRGHEHSEKNIRVKAGRRYCRPCSAEHSRRYQSKKLLARATVSSPEQQS